MNGSRGRRSGGIQTPVLKSGSSTTYQVVENNWRDRMESVLDPQARLVAPGSGATLH